MKSDTLLTELLALKQSILDGKTVTAWTRLSRLIDTVEAEIRTEANKTGGVSSIVKAAERIMKSASKNAHKVLHKAHRTDKHVTICDGFRVVRFNADTAPVLTEHPAGYEYIDVARIVEQWAKNTLPVQMPTLAELRAFIKTEKARLKAEKKLPLVRFILNEGTEHEIHVDAQFLLDMLEALPGATVTADEQKYKTSALYFKAANGDGVLLPLRQGKA